MAADYMINLQLVEDGFELPPGGLYDEQYKGMSAKEIYDLLDEDDEDEDYDGDLIDPSEDGTDAEVAKAEIENILLRAAKLSKDAGEKPGTIPGELDRLIGELLAPVLPWNVILHNYMDGYAKDDYSWKRPSRRFPDDYLPSMYSESLENISVLIDASGSISEEELQQFFTEIVSIKANMNPETFLIGSFDTRLYKPREFDSLKNYSVPGGGGTSSAPIQQFIDEYDPKVLIVFTDMQIYFNNLKEDFKDIIWINTGDKDIKPPVGKIINYEAR